MKTVDWNAMQVIGGILTWFRGSANNSLETQEFLHQIKYNNKHWEVFIIYLLLYIPFPE